MLCVKVLRSSISLSLLSLIIRSLLSRYICTASMRDTYIFIYIHISLPTSCGDFRTTTYYRPRAKGRPPSRPGRVPSRAAPVSAEWGSRGPILPPGPCESSPPAGAGPFPEPRSPLPPPSGSGPGLVPPRGAPLASGSYLGHDVDDEDCSGGGGCSCYPPCWRSRSSRAPAWA